MEFITNKRNVNQQKRRGGYYTPNILADYLTKWALQGKASRILEPSTGDGNFVVSVLRNLQQNNSNGDKQEIVAIEIEKDELSKAKLRVNGNRGNAKIKWICNDFFISYEFLQKGKKFDVILGNPPFIRFQYFDDQSRNLAFTKLKELGYKPTKLANVWVAFVELSIELLNNGGRIAMVVPAELLQVKYAAELRRSLSENFNHIIIIGFKKLVFPEIQQEVLLLLADGKRQSNGVLSDIHTIEFEDGKDLISQGKKLGNAISHMPSKHTRNGMKWTSLFLSNDAFNALDEAEKHTDLMKVGDFAEVNVGIVTGRNSFFVITDEFRKQLKATKFTTPIIGKTAALQSIIFDKGDYIAYKKKHLSALLDLNNYKLGQLPNGLIAYI